MLMQDNMGSIGFMIFYLVIIWIFLIKLIINNARGGKFKSRNIAWKWIFIAFFLLGFGDLFHLGFRIFNYFAGFSDGDPFYMITLGLGYIISGLTMTYFYVAVFHAWASIYGETYSTPSKIRMFTIILYIAFIARVILMFLPFNHWFEGSGTVDFGFDFRWITAIPIYIVGIISVFLLFKDSRIEMKEQKGIDPQINRGNFHASIWYIVSYVSYSITLFLVAIFPLTGLFMIPKTIAYLVAFFYHYKTILNREN
ncbi:MAG: hypothetical protein ACFE9S_17985 [Candidatus Hermodarchaeota archaeon]